VLFGCYVLADILCVGGVISFLGLFYGFCCGVLGVGCGW